MGWHVTCVTSCRPSAPRCVESLPAKLCALAATASDCQPTHSCDNGTKLANLMRSMICFPNFGVPSPYQSLDLPALIIRRILAGSHARTAPCYVVHDTMRSCRLALAGCGGSCGDSSSAGPCCPCASDRECRNSPAGLTLWGGCAEADDTATSATAGHARGKICHTTLIYCKTLIPRMEVATPSLSLIASHN